MSNAAEKIVLDDGVELVATPLRHGADKSLLRFITCGSVDDGKSTLIGRLLYDSKLILEDQLTTLSHDSERHGTNGKELDLALLVDGLEAEREQGITIDVAYRFFATPQRRFIVADTPGHLEYTRNMATGASTADLAIVLVDARQGVLPQTRRHAMIASLLGVRHLVLAVNKIDLVGYSESRFEQISQEFLAETGGLKFDTQIAIPISARYGDNVTQKSEHIGWYHGRTLLGHLETVGSSQSDVARPFRLPVQYVNRPHLDFRGYQGTVASGKVRVGTEISAAKSGQSACVKQLLVGDQSVQSAGPGDAVTLVLDREIDISRGEVMSGPEQKPALASKVTADLIWFDQVPANPGASYLLRTATDQSDVTLSGFDHAIDMENLAPVAASRVAMNDIAKAQIQLRRKVAFDTYRENRTTGAFILIDRVTNRTVAAGIVRALNAGQEETDQARPSVRSPLPIIWISEADKGFAETLGQKLEARFREQHQASYLVLSHEIRDGLNRDLGETTPARLEHVRRVAELSALMQDAHVIPIIALPLESTFERQLIFESLKTRTTVELVTGADRKNAANMPSTTKLSSKSHIIHSDHPSLLDEQLTISLEDWLIDANLNT